MSSPKRRKLVNEPVPSKELIHDINAEVDLEIALRQQLTQTLEARIAWGILLQESIQNGMFSEYIPCQILIKATGNGSASQETFRNVAMDALLSLERPSHCILSRDPTPPFNTSNRPARPSPKKLYPPNFKPKSSFLYTRSNPAVQQEGSHNHLYILRCPGCSKTTFTSLQGLLNHARLTHGLEWGTHDACIRACAVLDNDLDEEAGIEVGTGPAGVLPGLQTIFQMAVGGQSRGNGGVERNTGSEAQNNGGSTDGSHLNQTLGLHEDSPSLAPFLGKEAIRRQIKVWDEDSDIDLEINKELTQSLKRPWKMSFTDRNLAEPLILEPEHDTDESTPGEIVNNDIKHSDTKHSASAPIVPEQLTPHGSRFRFIARIVITDRSLPIPEDQRPNERKDFTHKWMISVDAPSYVSQISPSSFVLPTIYTANHITSVLNGVRVTPSDSTLSIPIPPPTTTPPFVVVGVSDKPFLARVELSFSGTSSDQMNQDQKVLFEHWVDLDPIGGRGVVIGQDQVLDVELDKNTVLKPSKLDYVPIDSKSHWNQVVTPRSGPETRLEISTSILTKLTKRFPMTLGSRPPNFATPYRLVASPSYFKTLVMGRRKAIEWGRARAIQAAYNEKIQTLQSPVLLPLTVARIYSWLSENDHFIKVADGTHRVLKQDNLGSRLRKRKEQYLPKT
ncbi:hypothetical protein BJ912DRAFT_861486 [Pholiota molesta]|nr:hypothetical protein BJ912DRAFT_861486 [Pholiota molesta]